MSEQFGSSMWTPLCEGCKNHPDPRIHRKWGSKLACAKCGSWTKWKLCLSRPMHGAVGRVVVGQKEAR